MIIHHDLKELQSIQDEPEPLSLILGGVNRQISFFKEVSEYKGSVAGTLTGNFDRATVAEIAPDIWEIAQAVRQQRHNEALQALDEATGQQKVSPPSKKSGV